VHNLDAGKLQYSGFYRIKPFQTLRLIIFSIKIIEKDYRDFKYLNQQSRPKGTGYVASPVELHSGFNTFFKRPEAIPRSGLGYGLCPKPLSTNNKKL
jgi:hypothetical protein